MWKNQSTNQVQRWQSGVDKYLWNLGPFVEKKNLKNEQKLGQFLRTQNIKADVEFEKELKFLYEIFKIFKDILIK